MMTTQDPQNRIAHYKDLDVWKEGMKIAGTVYRVTNSFPKHELYGITSQLRRAAVSVPANIAEGWGRNSKRSFEYFLKIARGSLLELETTLLLSQNLGYLEEEETSQALLESIKSESKMLNSLIQKL